MISSKWKQICINILSLCKHQQKTRNLKLKNFFCSLNYKSSRVFWGLEQLSSLFWRRVMAISKLGAIQPRFFFRGRNFDHFWILWRNFGSWYARKPIKGSKDSDDSLVSKKNSSEKFGSLVWRPGRRKLGQKRKWHPHCDVLAQRTPNPKRKNFFQSQQKTCWIRRWFEQLSSSIGWRVIALQTLRQNFGNRGTPLPWSLSEE